MDWVKVKTSHILFEYEDLSDKEFRGWIKSMALAASLEHQPTEKQLKKIIHHKTLRSLHKRLNERSETIQDTINNVLKDVYSVSKKRECERLKKRKYRVNSSVKNKNVPGDKVVDKENSVPRDKFVTSPGTPPYPPLSPLSPKNLLPPYNPPFNPPVKKRQAKIQGDSELVNSEKRQPFFACLPSFELGNYKGSIDDLISEIVELRYLQSKEKGRPISEAKRSALRVTLKESLRVDTDQIKDWLEQLPLLQEIKERLRQRDEQKKQIQSMINSFDKEREGKEMSEKNEPKSAKEWFEEMRNNHEFLKKGHQRTTLDDVNSRRFLTLYNSLGQQQKRDFRIIFKTGKECAMEFEGLTKEKAFIKAFQEAYESIVVEVEA